MLRRLFGFVERAAERAATLLVDGMEAAALRDEVERLTMRFAAKEQWANLKVGLLTAEVSNQEKLLAMPVMSAWRHAGGRWERQQTCAEPVADFAVACDDGSWWVRVDPQSEWSSLNVNGVWMCGGTAPDVDGAKAAVDNVLSCTYRLIGGSHGGPRWISAWRETVTRSVRHLHGYWRGVPRPGSTCLCEPGRHHMVPVACSLLWSRREHSCARQRAQRCRHDQRTRDQPRQPQRAPQLVAHGEPVIAPQEPR